MKITYYAIFQYDSDGIIIAFPDIPECFTCADSIKESKIMAQEVLETMLHNSIKTKLPKPSKKSELTISNNQKLFKITIVMKLINGRLFSDDVLELNEKNFALYE